MAYGSDMDTESLSFVKAILDYDSKHFMVDSNDWNNEIFS